MRTLAVLTLFAFATAAVAADKPEDKAKAAAVAFLKAVKAKDADAVLKLSDVPFLYKDGSLTTHKDADSLKKWVTEKLSQLGDPDKVPTTIDELLPFAEVKEKIKNEDERKLAEEAVGKDGFVAILSSSDGKKVAIPVRVKDGKAKVVGVIQG